MTKQQIEKTPLRDKLFTMAADDSTALPDAGSRMELLNEAAANGRVLIDDDEDKVLVDKEHEDQALESSASHRSEPVSDAAADSEEVDHHREVVLCLARLVASPDEEFDDVETSSEPRFNPERAEQQDQHKQSEKRIEQLQKLVANANAGDAEALAELRPLLDKHPEIWMALGNLARHAETLLINLVAGSNALVAEAMEKHLNHLNRTLVGENPTPLEVLCVQRVVAAYLHCQYADIRAASADGRMDVPNNTWAKRQELAEKRYERALKSLKLVRQMLPEAGPAEAAKSNAVPSKTNGQVKTTPATDASCPPSTNGHHNHHESNGHGKTTIVPKANGKPINRLAAATARTKQPMPQE